MQIQRVLDKYYPDTEDYAGEIDITYIPLEKLKEIFHPPDDDPLMYFVYNVGPEQAAILQRYVSEPIELERYLYQFGTYQV